jgi:hypothetical protein
MNVSDWRTISIYAVDLVWHKVQHFHEYPSSSFYVVERLVFHAGQQKGIKTHRPSDWSQMGIQKQLNALAKLPAFRKILENEVNKRKLVLRDVESCVGHIYHEVAKHAHGNREVIEINEQDFGPNELAALVSFFRLQSQWPNALHWKVVAPTQT